MSASLDPASFTQSCKRKRCYCSTRSYTFLLLLKCFGDVFISQKWIPVTVFLRSSGRTLALSRCRAGRWSGSDVFVVVNGRRQRQRDKYGKPCSLYLFHILFMYLFFARGGALRLSESTLVPPTHFSVQTNQNGLWLWWWGGSENGRWSPLCKWDVQWKCALGWIITGISKRGFHSPSLKSHPRDSRDTEVGGSPYLTVSTWMTLDQMLGVLVVPSKTPIEPLQTVCLFPVNYLNFRSKKPVQWNPSPIGAAGEGPRFHILFFLASYTRSG